jgi:hypothetical protein
MEAPSVGENLAQVPEHDHAAGEAGEPECPCYISGWEFGYKAGYAEALEEFGPRPEDDLAPGVN